MKQIIVTTEAKQKITLVYEDTTIVLDITYRPTTQSWTCNITFRDEVVVNGKKFIMGIPLLKQFNKPFDLLLLENQNTGIDPFKQDDFQDRVSLYLLEREDLIQIRGYDVI